MIRALFRLGSASRAGLLVETRTGLRTFSTSSKDAEDSPSSTALRPEDEYLVFPTKFPIFPYYVYSVPINKYLYEYIARKRLKYAAAFTLQPGVAKKAFTPYSLEHLELELGLVPSEPLDTQTKEIETISISNNNIIIDSPILKEEENNVYYVNGIDQVFTVGSVCKIATAVLAEGVFVAYLRSEIRLEVNVQKYKNHEGPLMYLSGTCLRNENILKVEAEHETLLKIHERIRKISRVNLPELAQTSIIKAIQLLGGYLCAVHNFSVFRIYNIFKTIDMSERAKMLVECYTEYLPRLQVQWAQLDQEKKVSSDEEKETIRNVYENMQDILGQSGDNKFVKEVRKKLKAGNFPPHVLKVIECELQTIQELGDSNPQANRKKQYVNLLLAYPFGVSVEEFFDIEKAKAILEEDHYGMTKVKQRILEFIAVSKLKGKFKSKVLLLHGPPGVGKTSIVKSIAKCLNRPYGRISLGGEYDTSILKGHRKTYVGAYPGRIFSTISKAKAENPVILLDEIDKMMTRSGGASLQDVVMEVLDPVQNGTLKDDFVDLEIDLSNVLFICTANSLETIFPPLLDRLERIEVSGYTTQEKQQIFKRYILQSKMKENGLPDDVIASISISEEVTNFLIEGYCKEAGVRNLVRKTDQIFQKIALEYVRNQPVPSKLTQNDVQKYLGLPRFHEARLFDKVPPVGVMVGLAYNAFGGSIMYIEAETASKHSSDVKETAKKDDYSGSLLVTGNIHEVMKESCQLAYTYAKYVTSTFFGNNYLQQHDIHLNFPQIEIGKDGPSAGVAITSTLVSLALKCPAASEVAMTGEITLSGNVNPIGGVKEKTMGAKRQGIRKLIFPEDNRRDVQQLEAEIKEGMEFHFVKHYFEAMRLIFGDAVVGSIPK